MTNIVAFRKPPVPAYDKDVVVQQLAQAAFNARIDPSEEQEFIFNFLYGLDFYHWTIVSETFEDVMHELGQRYIARHMTEA